MNTAILTFADSAELERLIDTLEHDLPGETRTVAVVPGIIDILRATNFVQAELDLHRRETGPSPFPSDPGSPITVSLETSYALVLAMVLAARREVREHPEPGP